MIEVSQSSPVRSGLTYPWILEDLGIRHGTTRVANSCPFFLCVHFASWPLESLQLQYQQTLMTGHDTAWHFICGILGIFWSSPHPSPSPTPTPSFGRVPGSGTNPTISTYYRTWNSHIMHIAHIYIYMCVRYTYT